MSARRGKIAPLDDLVIAHYYTRVSGDKQADEGLSIEQQPERCKEHIGRQDGWIIGEHFQDVLSGRRDDRNDYQRMLLTIRGLALQGKRQSLTVPAFDRLGRNVLERARAYKELAELGVPLHGVREGGVVPKFIYDIYASVAEEESRQLGVRLREINTGLANRGWHKPGSVAWGYQRRKATDAERAAGSPKTVLEVDETAAPYVREAWERLASGDAIRSIAVWVAGLPDGVRGGRNLGFQAVRKLFRAPVYVGRVGEYDEDEPTSVLDLPKGHEPALIDDDVWCRAMGSKRMAAKMPRQASGDYPLTGLLRCYRCGSRMSGRLKGTQGGTRAPRREYICHAGLTLGASQIGTKCLATVKADMIESCVLGTVREVLEAARRPAGQGRMTREIERRERAEAAHDGTARIPALEAARDRARKRIAGASKLLIDGALDREAYDITRAELSTELEQIDAELSRLRGRARPAETISLDALLRGLAGWADAIERAEPLALREALGVLLESVEPVKLGRGVYEARPTWTGVGTRLFWAARALSDSANLVSVDHLGRTECSTYTIVVTDHPRALRTG
jgi:DNA invertase Pin-like site-specific DNA recombinase